MAEHGCKPIEGRLEVGDTVGFKLGLKDDSIPEAVETEEIEIRIDSEASPPPPRTTPPRPKEPKSGDGEKGKGDGKDAPTHGLPKCVLLTKDGREVDGYAVEVWPPGYDENDGGTIVEVGEGEVIYKINYDNAYHIKYRIQQRGQVAKDVITEKYILGMRILLLGFEHAFRNAKLVNGAEPSAAEEERLQRGVFERDGRLLQLELPLQVVPEIVEPPLFLLVHGLLDGNAGGTRQR